MTKYNSGNVKLRQREVKSTPYPCEEMILWPNPLVLFNLFFDYFFLSLSQHGIGLEAEGVQKAKGCVC